MGSTHIPVSVPGDLYRIKVNRTMYLDVPADDDGAEILRPDGPFITKGSIVLSLTEPKERFYGIYLVKILFGSAVGWIIVNLPGHDAPDLYDGVLEKF